ncbi:MAG TPA: LysR substrate-binding domain-containing protein [Geminicoccaceae bacterium]|nr:LysR substrate-binding domain-containing protein [Geminicoccaceae bacterium]
MLNDIDLSRADLNLLVLFEAVLRERHVGRAANRLNLTPSAVSHGLGRLRRLLNDPLFLRTPKGVVPTARATELAGPIADILARVRSVVATATAFDPASSTRRFVVGAPDGVSAVVLPPLLAEMRARAPGIGVSVRQILPPSGGRPAGRPWEAALAELEARALDVAVVPLDEVPARFADRTLYEEDFVIAMRAGHPFADDPSLERYCRMRHLVVSLARDDHNLVDDALARRGLARRVALAVPGFMFALALVAETDMLAAVPRRLVAMHAPRFGLASTDAPLPLPRFRIRAVATGAAMTDAGVAWLFETLVRVSRAA